MARTVYRNGRSAWSTVRSLIGCVILRHALDMNWRGSIQHFKRVQVIQLKQFAWPRSRPSELQRSQVAYLDSNGYRIVYVPNHPCADKRGRVREHRFIWHSHYGSIPDGYVVHHKDGDKANNELANLELLSELEHKQHHAPGRLPSIPRNKGQRSLLGRVCGVCGSLFVRKRGEVWKAERRGNTICCSKSCTLSLMNAARMKETA